MARDDQGFSTGDVTGSVFQAQHMHGDVHVHQGRSPRPVFDPPPTWDEAPEPPPEIQSLLWAQLHAAHETPYRLPGARKPSLDTVYVRQDLGNAVDEPETPRHGPVLDDDGRLIETPARPAVRITVRPPSRAMSTALDADDHLVVTGGPGLGKSTLTLRLAADIARHWKTRADTAPLAEPVVPLRITARALAARLDLPFAEALADSAAAEYGPLLRSSVDPDLFTTRPVGCRWLLLVDGLDEVSDADQRLRLVNALAAWASDDAYRLLLTTRPTEGGALASLHRISAVRYEIQPFDALALRRFAANWFPEDDAQRFLREIREAHLDELLQVPLLATIAAIIYAEYTAEPLPGNQYSLYDTYLAHIRRDQPDRFKREALLEHLARVRLETELPLLPAARAWVGGTVWPEELTDYLLSAGPFILRGDDLQFLHQSFAEHLAATSRARELPDEFCPEAFADLLHAAEARESGRFARAVLLHHTRLHPAEADRLLSWLHQGDASQHLLAARLLAHHLPASPEAFLATVRGWAMTTHLDAPEILAETTRATRYPGLVRWLTDLMNERAAPMQSRAECATALTIRIRGPHSAHATTFLRYVVDAPKALVSDRLKAAEALAQCGTPERDAAERGLREVLIDPNADDSSLRVAAVVLAAFEGDARKFATDTLIRVLSDEDSRPGHITEAATGLVEISPEFADFCAHHLLVVLRGEEGTAHCWDSAALALASISHAHLDQAAAALTARITDRRLSARGQVRAARALSELGPQHRRAAGRLIATMAADAARAIDRSILLGHLVTHQPERDTALAGLRAMLSERHQNWNNITRAAAALGGVGPAYRNEAAEALLGSRPPRGSHDQVTVLDEVVRLGEPHRARALRELRDLIHDSAVAAEVRCRAANTLIRSGPDFHPEAVALLWQITSEEPQAFYGLARTGAGEEALTVLLKDAQSEDSDAMHVLATTVTHGERADEAVEVMRTAVRDSSRSMRTRITAASGLSALSGRFDRKSAAELSRMITGEPMITDFVYAVTYHSSSGPGPRGELARALLIVLADERTSSERRWSAVQALQVLGHGGEPETLAAARRLAEFPGAHPEHRALAAAHLASWAPEHLALAAGLVASAAKYFTDERLNSLVGDLRSSDVELSGRFRAQLATGTTAMSQRIAVATVLGEVDELRRIAQDETVRYKPREWSYDGLALTEAIVFHHAVLDDPDVPVEERGEAARALARLDRRTWLSSIDALWRLTTDPDITSEGRAKTLRYLDVLLRPRSERFRRAVIEVLRGPDVLGESWRPLIGTLRRSVRTDLERSRLHIRSISIEVRVPTADLWDDLPLRDEAVAEIRDVIAGPETTRRERIRAAVALFGVSFTFHAEAVEVLERLPGRAARNALAGMGEAQWWRVRDEAFAAVTDVSLPRRVRGEAACVLGDLNVDVPGEVWLNRIDGLAAREDIDALRRIRDTDELVAARVRAAEVLRTCTRDDRVVGMELLARVAEDGVVRPALRVRSVGHLLKFGAAGRKRAAAIARAMMADEGLPVLVRAKAAVALHQAARTARREVMATLAELAALAEPLRRVEVLRRLGALDAARAVELLWGVEGGAVVRMRAARVAVGLRHDQREWASGVARAVAWDEGVARHVRRNAARDLALWSSLMREDARGLLVRLRDACSE
ncbi:NACHT domain-containing protein [Lentzea sp. NPDC058450]|uniref:NACHT domain-containing protein n=1 Tax=Lentzea sp. NPDC058450 TaxID=3346505 RepID=UPI00365F9AAA